MTSAESIVPPAHLAPAHTLRSYRGKVGHWDEAVTPEGLVRPHWQRFAAAVDSQTLAERKAGKISAVVSCASRGSRIRPPTANCRRSVPGSSTPGRC